MQRATAIVLTAAVVIGRLFIAPRLNLPTFEGSYEAFAHPWIGGLVGAWWTNRKRLIDNYDAWLLVAVAVSLFELAAFIIQKATHAG